MAHSHTHKRVVEFFFFKRPAFLVTTLHNFENVFSFELMGTNAFKTAILFYKVLSNGFVQFSIQNFILRHSVLRGTNLCQVALLLEHFVMNYQLFK